MKENVSIQLANEYSFDMLHIEGGQFLMGDDQSGIDREKPAHQVEVSDFYLGKYQVTQALWQSVMGENPSRFKGENRPVEQVSWEDAKRFIDKLNEGNPNKFRLPSEAEWEYAARGGKYSQDYVYCGSDKLRQVGWYNENSNRETHDVGLKLANELGLHDMSGNVYEWCEDLYNGEFYEKCQQQGTVKNPVNDSEGDTRVLRGGSWLDGAQTAALRIGTAARRTTVSALSVSGWRCPPVSWIAVPAFP